MKSKDLFINEKTSWHQTIRAWSICLFTFCSSISGIFLVHPRFNVCAVSVQAAVLVNVHVCIQRFT